MWKMLSVHTEKGHNEESYSYANAGHVAPHFYRKHFFYLSDMKSDLNNKVFSC
jgi:hypothetical protein